MEHSEFTMEHNVLAVSYQGSVFSFKKFKIISKKLNNIKNSCL
jgi:hypothetical protein